MVVKKSLVVLFLLLLLSFCSSDKRSNIIVSPQSGKDTCNQCEYLNALYYEYKFHNGVEVGTIVTAIEKMSNEESLINKGTFGINYLNDSDFYYDLVYYSSLLNCKIIAINDSNRNYILEMRKIKMQAKIVKERF